jgi:hypothetical protein
LLQALPTKNNPIGLGNPDSERRCQTSDPVGEVGLSHLKRGSRKAECKPHSLHPNTADGCQIFSLRTANHNLAIKWIHVVVGASTPLTLTDVAQVTRPVAKQNPTESHINSGLFEVPIFMRRSPKTEIGTGALRSNADKNGAVLASA